MMTPTPKHTQAAAVFTDLVLEVFRLNGRLLSAGDQLGRPEELTSARWQVLGAIELAGEPMSVAQIGRRMGLSRQAVQRVANDLEKHGFIRFEMNPDHLRAKLIVLSQKGEGALGRIKIIQIEWANALTSNMDARRIADALDVLRQLQDVTGAGEPSVSEK